MTHLIWIYEIRKKLEEEEDEEENYERKLFSAETASIRRNVRLSVRK